MSQAVAGVVVIGLSDLCHRFQGGIRLDTPIAVVAKCEPVTFLQKRRTHDGPPMPNRPAVKESTRLGAFCLYRLTFAVP